jgi:hypothetical protein
MKRTLMLAVIIVSALALTACAGDDAVTTGGLAITGIWVRPSPMTAGNGAAYMVIDNKGGEPDALIGAEADFCDTVEIHETSMMEGDMMQMQPVERIEIPAGGSATLEPGGYHVMLIGINESLDPGDTVTLTLIFEKAGAVQVQAEVREE